MTGKSRVYQICIPLPCERTRS